MSGLERYNLARTCVATAGDGAEVCVRAAVQQGYLFERDAERILAYIPQVMNERFNKAGYEHQPQTLGIVATGRPTMKVKIGG